MNVSLSGFNWTSDRVEIDATGAAITSPYPVKSFLVKSVGGQCMFKRSSTIADADAYIIDDGETIGMNIDLTFNSDDAACTIGFFKSVSGTVTIHVLLGY